MKKVISMFLILALCSSLVGCGSKETVNEVSEREDTNVEENKAEVNNVDENSKYKISLVTDVSGVNDQSFNQSAWEGMEQSEELLVVEISYKESNQNADYVPNLESMYDEGKDLIWGVGYLMSDAILEAAQLNPEQNYAIVDSGNWEETPSNLLGVLFKAQDSGFLVGYIAGKMTETGKVGFIGGMSIPSLWAFECGYTAGVAYANPDAEVVVQYAESFTDVALGKSIGNGMFVQDIDIIFTAAGGLGNGVIEACKENDKWAIGVDIDQNYLAPDHVLTSAMKCVDKAVLNVNKSIVNGTFEGGKTVVYGLADGAVGIAPSSAKNVPEEILNEVSDVEAKIVVGEIETPGTYEELDIYMKNLSK